MSEAIVSLENEVTNESEQLFRLENLEKIIERGQKAFYETGNALKTINEKELYKEQYSSFETYCQERWGMTSRNANYLMTAADIMNNLKENNCSQLPVNEYQIRALKSLEPEDQVKVWNEVINNAPNGKITGDLVKEVVKKHQQQKQPIEQQILLTKEAKKIYDALSTLSKCEVGKIREAIFSPSGEELEMPKLIQKVIDSFNNLELELVA